MIKKQKTLKTKFKFMEANKMKFLNKLTMVLAKICEIGHWILAGSSAVISLTSIFLKNEFSSMVSNFANSSDFQAYGLEITPFTATGEVNTIAVTLFFVAATISFILMAMVFRNINLILKTINGKNKHTTSTSPFQKDVIRMVKEIGMFSMAIPVVGFLFSTIITAISIISGVGGGEVAINLDGFALGLICLSLSNVFTYGASLENDVDGLV